MTKPQKIGISIGAVALLSLVTGLLVVAWTRDAQKQVADRITAHFTPPELLGVTPEQIAAGRAAYAAFPRAFQADVGDKPDNSRANVRLWELVRSVDVPGKPLGQDFGCGPQQTGDCVSWGGAGAKSIVICKQVHKGQRPASEAGWVFTGYEYGVCRVNSGKSRLPCHEAGAFPDVYAMQGKDFGYLLAVVDKCPPYTGKLAKQWGCTGAPAEWVKIAKTRAGGDAYPIRSTDELRDAICNGYPCTIAVSFCPGNKFTKDGRGCLNWNGPNQGGHQMYVAGYDGSLGPGREYFYIQNSHGPDAEATCEPQQGEPFGGFWITMKTAERWVAEGSTWAISDVAGFPVEDEIDWSAFDRFKVQFQPKEKNHEGQNARRAVRGPSVFLGV